MSQMFVAGRGAGVGAHGHDEEELWDVPDVNAKTVLWVLTGCGERKSNCRSLMPGEPLKMPRGLNLCRGCGKYPSMYAKILPAKQFLCLYCGAKCNQAEGGHPLPARHISKCTGLPPAYHANKCTCR